MTLQEQRKKAVSYISEHNISINILPVGGKMKYILYDEITGEGCVGLKEFTNEAYEEAFKEADKLIQKRKV